ncbi:MAG: SDR family oxidoreductase [Balneolaceae bacterium]
MQKTVLITGASSGIGKALANEFANNSYNLVIVAEKARELSQAADEIKNNRSVDITEIPEDLTHEHVPQEIYDHLKKNNIQVDVLVNNAGVGQREKFHESDIEKDIKIIRLNIEATTRLTKLFVKDMVTRGDGKILNVGSVAGFQPGPLLAVYHASKAFVVSFSEAISDELEGTGVTVTALCPGPTDTHFAERADMENSRIFQDGMVMKPSKVAESGYKALMDGERIIIPGMSNKALTFTRRLIPKSMQASLNKKFYEVKEEA